MLWRLPVVGVVEVRPSGWSTLPPVLMANDGSDRIASLLYWKGIDGWEPTTVGLFLDLLAPSSTFIDVGANSGLFSLLAARRHPTVLVHALEPVSRVFALLEANVALNRLQTVRCHPVACGERGGRVTVYVPADEPMPMMASLIEDWVRDRRDEEVVDCVTVDGLTEEDPRRVQVIKIDAEGSEDAVLRGAAATLARDRPFVFCEVLARGGLDSRVADALEDHDYRFFALSPMGARPCQAVHGGIDDDESHNYLFAPRDRLPELEAILARRCNLRPGSAAASPATSTLKGPSSAQRSRTYVPGASPRGR